MNVIAGILGIGCTSAYKLTNSGPFKTIRIGNMICISEDSFKGWPEIEEVDSQIK